MLERLTQILAGPCQLPRGARVLVALSGGGDSVALLRLLLEVAKDFPLKLRAAHLDHGLRPESARDALWVTQLCGQWQLPLAVERVEVAVLARRLGCGIEDAGRQSRREFLQRQAELQGCDAIALGHQRGDQAETVLHRLIRGTSLSGLASMRFRHGPFIRPLLGFSRQELESYLAFKGQSFLQDASNRDPAFTRNRLRHEVLPLLQQFNPRLESHLAALAGRAAEEEDYWQQQVLAALADLRLPAQGELRLARPALAALHPALSRRVLRQALEEVRGGLGGVDAGHLEALRNLIVAEAPQAELHLPQCWVAVRFDALVLRQAPPLPAELPRLLVSGPGDYRLADGQVIRFEVKPAPLGESWHTVEFDRNIVNFPFEVRGFVPGDRIRLEGLQGRKKLKELFSETRIEQELRRCWPLLVAKELLWVVGLRRSSVGRPVSSTTEVLRVRVLGAESSTIRL